MTAIPRTMHSYTCVALSGLVSHPKRVETAHLDGGIDGVIDLDGGLLARGSCLSLHGGSGERRLGRSEVNGGDNEHAGSRDDGTRLLSSNYSA